MCHLVASREASNLVNAVLNLSTQSREVALRSIEYQIMRGWELKEKQIRFNYETGESFRGLVILEDSQFKQDAKNLPRNTVEGITWQFG